MTDEEFMRVAITETKKAELLGEKTSVGAVIVQGSVIISQAHNTAKHADDPTGHAEINAIRQAAKKLKSKNLPGCTLYVTIEPCVMCFGAAVSAKIPKIVYGLSLEDMAQAGHRNWKVSSTLLNKQFENILEIEGGFLKEECLQTLSNRIK